MKRVRNSREMPLGLAGALACLLAAGCASAGARLEGPRTGREAAAPASKLVQAGDTVTVQYLCRLESGEVAASTGSAENGLKKSGLFAEPEAPGPLQLVAGADKGLQQPQTPFEQHSLEQEVAIRLAGVVIGMKEGERRTAEIRAEDAPPAEARKYIARLTRVRTRSKEWKMPIGDYEYRAHRAPEVGQEFTYDSDFPGRVESVTDKEVTVRLFATPGAVIATPFGPGRVREEGDNYRLDIDAHKGALVRAGEMTGRIADVDDRTITVDFGNPFGGETLFCDVTVDAIADAKVVKNESSGR